MPARSYKRTRDGKKVIEINPHRQKLRETSFKLRRRKQNGAKVPSSSRGAR